MNLFRIFTMKSEAQAILARHPELAELMRDVGKEGTEAGTKLELKVTSPKKESTAEMTIAPEDVEYVQLLRSIVLSWSKK